MAQNTYLKSLISKYSHITCYQRLILVPCKHNSCLCSHHTDIFQQYVNKTILYFPANFVHILWAHSSQNITGLVTRSNNLGFVYSALNFTKKLTLVKYCFNFASVDNIMRTERRLHNLECKNENKLQTPSRQQDIGARVWTAYKY